MIGIGLMITKKLVCGFAQPVALFCTRTNMDCVTISPTENPLGTSFVN